MSTAEDDVPRSGLLQYQDEIAEVCAQNDVPVELVLALIALEERHQNLHTYGARPRLRRIIAEILEAHLQTLPDS